MNDPTCGDEYVFHLEKIEFFLSLWLRFRGHLVDLSCGDVSEMHCALCTIICITVVRAQWVVVAMTRNDGL